MARNKFTCSSVKEKHSWSDVWKEFISLMDFVWFMLIISILYFMMYPISLAFVGRLGTVYLDGVGLGNTIFNVFGILVFNGVMTGLDTTMSQSFGSSNKKMVGVYFQRGLIIYHLVVAVCIAALLNAEYLLVLIGQNREVARLSGLYVALLAIGLPFYTLWVMATRFFRLQNVLWLSCTSLILMLATTFTFHYVFVTVLGYGVEGSAFAQIITYFIGAAFMMILTPFQRKVLDRSWDGLTEQAWQDWGPISTLSFTGLFIICLQWWGLEICTLLSGTLGEVELAAQAILFQLNYFLYLVPSATGLSCNIMIGQHVGANRPSFGKLNMQLGWMLTWILMILNVVLVMSLREYVPHIFTDEEKVAKLTTETLPYVVLYHVFDSTVSSSLGMVRGIAKQKMGAIVSLIGIYFVGLPCAILLTFYLEMGVKGFWIGPAIGLAVETVILLFLLARTDWERECEEAQIRAGVDMNKNKTADPFKEDSETAELLPDKRYQRTKRFGPELASSQQDISVLKRGVPLTKTQLLARRGPVVLISMIVLVAGIILHFTMTVQYPQTVLSNSTYLNETFDSVG